jgi:hypothetical protein
MDPGLLSNRYQVMRSIGGGAVTAVLEARDRLTGKRVAIKVPIGRFANDKAFLLRLEREVAALAGFRHPNVAGVHAVERHSGGFAVAELVDGPSLREVLAARGPLPPARAARAAAGVCAALASAHGHGIVHGHLTPDNVLLTGDGQVKLTDFRVAVAARPFSTASDPAADLRALSRCLAAMLTGLEPADDVPVRLGPEVPPALAAIVNRAADDPINSYSSAADIGRDLDRFLATIHQSAVSAAAHSTVPPYDPPQPSVTIPSHRELVLSPSAAADLRGVPPPRRRRGLAVAAGLVAALAIAGGAVAAVQRLGGQAGTAPADLAAPAPPTTVVLMTTTSRTPTPAALPTTTTQPTIVAPVTGAPTTTSPVTSSQTTTSVRPAQRVVPNVVGLHKQQAFRVLEQAGLVPRISASGGDQGQAQRVTAQQPVAGKVVPAGSEVILTFDGQSATGR